MIELEDPIYVFRFSPLDNPPSRDMMYQVYTTEPKLMNRFLNQHRFNDGMQYVEITSPEKTDIDVAQELEVFHFGSNIHRDKIYEIVTSQQLIDEMCKDLGDKLSRISMFNELITYQDIPIMETLRDNIGELPYGHLLNVMSEDEYQTMRDDVDKMYNDRSGAPIDYTSDPNGSDDSIIYRELMESATVTNIQPGTIESYIETFVSLITDEYK